MVSLCLHYSEGCGHISSATYAKKEIENNEPIYIAWENSNYNSVKQEIIEKGWTDYPLEDTYYVYDSVYGWIADDGLASDPFCLLGGCHIRIWNLSDGDIAGAAHQDSGVPHHAIGSGNAEELVAGFYNDPDDTRWHVYQDDYALNSYIQSPYSNGMATRIFWSWISATSFPECTNPEW